MNKEIKDIIMNNLEEILQEVHKCGYFGESWKLNSNVSQLIKNFTNHLEEV